jgi:hypothetical protein
MFVWEMIACRLRAEGWSVRHAAAHNNDEFTVYFQRPGFADEASGPTLTDAYAEAARVARAQHSPLWVASGPHFALMAVAH